jgi:hypothetical protein
MSKTILTAFTISLIVPLAALAEAAPHDTGPTRAPVSAAAGYINKPSVERQIAEGRDKLGRDAEGRQVMNKFNGIVADRFSGQVTTENQKLLWIGVFRQVVKQKQAALGRPLTPEEQAEAAADYLQITQRSIQMAQAGRVPEAMKAGSSEVLADIALVALIVGAAMANGVVYVDQPYYHCTRVRPLSHDHDGDCEYESRAAFDRGGDHGFYDGRNGFSYDPWHAPRPDWYHGFCDECERRAYADGYEAGYRRGQHLYHGHR